MTLLYRQRPGIGRTFFSSLIRQRRPPSIQIPRSQIPDFSRTRVSGFFACLGKKEEEKIRTCGIRGKIQPCDGICSVVVRNPPPSPPPGRERDRGAKSEADRFFRAGNEIGEKVFFGGFRKKENIIIILCPTSILPFNTHSLWKLAYSGRCVLENIRAPLSYAADNVRDTCRAGMMSLDIGACLNDR